MFMRTELITVSGLAQQFGRFASTISLKEKIDSSLGTHRWVVSLVVSSRARNPAAGLGPPESRSSCILHVCFTPWHNCPCHRPLGSEMWPVGTPLCFSWDAPPTIRCVTGVILFLSLRADVAGGRPLCSVLMNLEMVYLCCSGWVSYPDNYFFVFVDCEFRVFFLISEKCFLLSSAD